MYCRSVAVVVVDGGREAEVPRLGVDEVEVRAVLVGEALQADQERLLGEPALDLPVVGEVHHVGLACACPLEDVAERRVVRPRRALDGVGEHVGVRAERVGVRRRDRVAALRRQHVEPVDDPKLAPVVRPRRPHLSVLPHRHLQPHEHVGREHAVGDRDTVHDAARRQPERVGEGAFGPPLLHERHGVPIGRDRERERLIKLDARALLRDQRPRPGEPVCGRLRRLGMGEGRHEQESEHPERTHNVGGWIERKGIGRDRQTRPYFWRSASVGTPAWSSTRSMLPPKTFSLSASAMRLYATQPNCGIGSRIGASVQ